MKKLLFLLFMVGGLCLGTNAWGQLLPKPISLTQRDGEFILPEHVGVKTNLKGNDKTRLLHAVETALGVKTQKGAVLELRLDKKMGKGRERTEGAGYGPYEGYTLEVTPKKVIIRGGSAAGLFYGVQTLGQLAKDGKIPAVSITDEPKFGYRGFMLDCSRLFLWERLYPEADEGNGSL